MTPTQIIAKIRERFPELGKNVLMTPECCCVGHNACPDFHFKKEWSPLDWSHVLRVVGTYTGIYGDGKVYALGDKMNCRIDLTKSPEWNIENNTDFTRLLERCLTE